MKIIKYSSIVTLLAWIVYHPDPYGAIRSEYVVVGILAICSGMIWYLFSEETERNTRIAIFLVLLGLIAPKVKFLGEVVCFIAIFAVLKKKLDFKSPRTLFTVGALATVVLAATWSKFDVYYVSGLDSDMARPLTWMTSFKILEDYIPFGPGMGTFASNGAWKFYSPLYEEYELNHIWGLTRGGGFICDTFYPSLSQYGIVGVFLFFWYWKRRYVNIINIVDMRYYRVALMAFLCLALEQIADSTLVSGKGMGYCMLIGLCLNANRNMGYTDDGKLIRTKADSKQCAKEVDDETRT